MPMMNIHEPKSIAIFIPNWLGDVAMCTPALRALCKRFPDAQIIIFGRAAPCALLAGFPGISRVVPIPSRLSFGDMLGVRKTLGLRPDLAVLFPHSFRAALLAKVIGARQTLGYTRGGRSFLLDIRVEPNRVDGKISPVYMAREYLDLLEALGCQDDGEGLGLNVSKDTLEEIRRELPTSRPLVGIAPGAAFGPSKCWLPERYAEVADRLFEKNNALCILLTGPGEETTRDAVLAAAKHPLHICDDAAPSVERLKAIISELDLFIGNDSGPRHIAIAFKKPVICIMGSTRPVYSAGPYETGEILRVEVDCGPCQKPVCATDHRCMTGVSSERVYQAARAFL